jgi:hypothetical protein
MDRKAFEVLIEELFGRILVGYGFVQATQGAAPDGVLTPITTVFEIDWNRFGNEFPLITDQFVGEIDHVDLWFTYETDSLMTVTLEGLRLSAFTANELMEPIRPPWDSQSDAAGNLRRWERFLHLTFESWASPSDSGSSRPNAH